MLLIVLLLLLLLFSLQAVLAVENICEIHVQAKFGELLRRTRWRMVFNLRSLARNWRVVLGRVVSGVERRRRKELSFVH